jgi:hypothetical protein
MSCDDVVVIVAVHFVVVGLVECHLYQAKDVSFAQQRALVARFVDAQTTWSGVGCRAA